jgi:hypothetical protein
LSKILSEVVPAPKTIKSQALENAPNLASEEDEDENLHFLHYTIPQELRFRKSPLRPVLAQYPQNRNHLIMKKRTEASLL